MISKLSHHHHHNENNKRSHHKDNDTSSIEACLMDVYLYKQLTTETITTSTRSSASSNGSSSNGTGSSSSSSSTSKASDGRIKDISKLTSKFIIITYSTNNIIDYTLYSFGINALYAHSKSHHHHQDHQDHNPVDATINIYSTSPSGGFEYESRDQRWNKVKIIEVLLSQLQQQYRNQSTSSFSSSSSSSSSSLSPSSNILSHPSSSHSSQVEYIIWMDSDLIILNFDFDFNHITTRYPTADIIISRDAYPDNGMVNTGMINYTS